MDPFIWHFSGLTNHLSALQHKSELIHVNIHTMMPVASASSVVDSGDHVCENLSMNPPTYFSKPFKLGKIRLSCGISHCLCVNTSKRLHMVSNPTIVSYMNELL